MLNRGEDRIEAFAKVTNLLIVLFLEILAVAFLLVQLIAELTNSSVRGVEVVRACLAPKVTLD